MIAGLSGAIPDDAFDAVEAAARDLVLPMRLCVQLDRLGRQLLGS